MMNAWPSLQGEKYLSLTTFRKSGQAVATPLWFVEHNGTILIYTMSNSGKVKRLRNNPRVELAACDATGKVHGPTLRGTARLLEPHEARFADRLLNRKYWSKRLLNLGAMLSRHARSYYQISPA